MDCLDEWVMLRNPVSNSMSELERLQYLASNEELEATAELFSGGWDGRIYNK